MKNKKFLILVLALSMFIPTAFVAKAAGGYTAVPDEFHIYAWNGGGASSSTDVNDSNSKSIYTFGDSKSGDVSVYFDLTGTNSSKKSSLAWKNRICNKQMIAGHTYVIGAWMKQFGTKSGGSIYLSLDYSASKRKGIDLSQAEAKKTVDGWTQYEGTFTPEDDFSGLVCFGTDGVYGENYSFLIDDIYIYDQANPEVNLVDDASFEMRQKQPKQGKAWNEAISVTDWESYSEAGTNVDSSYRRLVSSEGGVYEGEYAMYIWRRGKNKADTSGIAYSRYKTRETMNPGTYTVTFYTKGGSFRNYYDSSRTGYAATMADLRSTSNGIAKALFGFQVHQTVIGIKQDGVDIYSQNDSATCARLSHYDSFEYVGDGWVKWTKTFQTTVASNEIQFALYGAVCDDFLYFDELSVKDTNGKEYCPDGGFETGYNYDDGIPSRFVAYSASEVNNGVGVIAWENPTKTYYSITDITLTVNGEAVDVSDVSKDSAAKNQVVLENLVDNETYECALSITTSDGRTHTTTKSFVCNSADEYKYAGTRVLSNWKIERTELDQEYANTIVEFDDVVKASGASSVKIVCSKDGITEGVSARFVQDVTLDQGKEYVASYKYRYISAVENTVNPPVKELFYDDVIDVTTKYSQDWTERTYEIPAYDYEAEGEPYTYKFGFEVINSVDAFWIDDVAIYEVQNGEIVGENLVKNGGFESDKDWEIVGYEYLEVDGEDIIGEVTELKTGEILGAVKILNYTNPDLDVAVITAIYENGLLKDVSVVEDSVPLSTSLDTPATIGGSVTVPGMDPEKTYELKVMVWDSIAGMNPLTEADILR